VKRGAIKKIMFHMSWFWLFETRVAYRLEVEKHEGRNMLVGYAPTSTTDQKAGLAAQERDLKAARCLDSCATKAGQNDALLT